MGACWCTVSKQLENSAGFIPRAITLSYFVGKFSKQAETSAVELDLTE